MPDERAWIGLVSILGALVLVIATTRGRMPRATAWRYAAIWAAIFAALFVAALVLHQG